MFKVLVLVAVVACLARSTDALSCYTCASGVCVTTTCTASTGSNTAYCYKYTYGGVSVSSCDTTNSFCTTSGTAQTAYSSYGMTCCATSLCNSATKSIVSLKMLVLVPLAAIFAKFF